jgi:hypothetical protein
VPNSARYLEGKMLVDGGIKEKGKERKLCSPGRNN